VGHLHHASGTSRRQLPWNDFNGDRFVQADEMDASDPLGVSNHDPRNLDTFTSPNVIDPDISARATDVLIVGVEREVIPDFVFGAHFIFGRFTNLVWQDWDHAGISIPYVGIETSDVVPATVGYEGRELIYYELPFRAPAKRVLKNWPDYRQRYRALKPSARKRLSNRQPTELWQATCITSSDV
jgi:hypothetical protein